MREIKFRAFIVGKDTNWMAVQGNSGDIDTPAKFLALYGDHEIMQYTGLKDMNGVEIYEGDIVKHYYIYPDGKKCSVYPIEWGKIGYSDKGIGWILDPEDVERIEVIGNIYENPELLQG